MNYESIIKLLDAGYTREEIMSMKEQPEEKPEEAPEEKTEDIDSFTGVINDLKDAIASMKNEITAMNIMNSRMTPEDIRTGDDIMADIINPPKFNKEKDGK